MKNIFNSISQKERKILGLFCLILGLALFFYVFFALGIKRSYFRSEDLLSAVQGDFQAAETSTAKKTMESQKWEMAQQDMKELQGSHFYSDLEWVKELRTDLQHILETSRIQHAGKKFEYEFFEKEKIQKVNVEFTVTGRYVSLKEFIHAVESFQKFLMIERIDFLDIDPLGRGIKLKIQLAGYHAIF